MLNPQQLEAAHYLHGPLLILAGAGSGKTTVLMERISRMIESGISPSNILAVTFTQKASEEMRERIEKKVGTSLSEDIWMMTFHAMCTKILQSEGDKTSFIKSDFSILEPSESKSILRSIIKDELKLDPNTVTPSGMLYYISMLKNELIDPVSFEEGDPKHPYIDWEKAKELFKTKIPSAKKELIAETYKRYQEKCAEYNVADFDDLIFHTVFLFHHRADVLEFYQNKFRYMMIDEYQDTNHAQYVLMKMLASKFRNIGVVGDDFQSIYAFRGSDIRNILKFDQDYPDAKIVKLEENYRSSPYVLAAANQIISKNKHQKEKKLFTSKKEGDKLGYYCAKNERDEVRFVINEITKQVKKGKKYRDFAVLFRTNEQSRIFEEMFMRVSIPYQIVGSNKFLERPEIRVALSYLNFIEDECSLYDFKRIINQPKRHIDKKTILRLGQKAKGGSLFEAFSSLKEELSFQEKNALTSFFILINELRKQKEKVSLGDFIAFLLFECEYLSTLHFFADEPKLHSLAEFMGVAYDFQNTVKNGSVKDFLNHLVWYGQLEFRTDVNAVRLMTLHGAKGLEFPVVFLVGMEEGIFPHLKSMEGFDLEEERRLCYVGITRAKEKLFLSHAKNRTLWGKEEELKPSRFLYEFNEELFDSLQSLYKI